MFWSQIVFEIRNNDILGSLLCLKIHAVRLCTLATDVFTMVFFICMWPFRLAGKPEEQTLLSQATYCFCLSLLQCRSCELHFCFSGIPTFSYWIESCNTSSVVQSCLSGSFQAWIVYPILNSSIGQTCLNNYSNYAANNRWLAFHLDVLLW